MTETSGENKIKFKKILVVEDEKGLLKIIEIILKSEGYEVLLSQNGNDAYEILKNDSDVDLMLTDVRLPGIDGMELLEKAKQFKPSLTVIVMSAYGTIELALDAINKGAYHFIPKPFKKEILLHTLSKAEEVNSLTEENKKLKARLGKTPAELPKMIGNSEDIQKIIFQIRKIAPYGSTVLITGESGSGKEIAARMIHAIGNPDGPFVAVNCGAIPEQLLESELFGYVKGAFTGAVTDKTGLFEEADGGVLFLDEIAELPLHVQVKLLRAIQEGTIRRVGSNEQKKINVRLIAATSRDLEEEMKSGRFRSDLFYRLNVVPLKLPSLRHRSDDIPLLADFFLKKTAEKFKAPAKRFSKEAMKKLQSYEWPGNIRELENLIERLSIMVDGEEITEPDLPDYIRKQDNILTGILQSDDLSIKKATRILEKEFIKRALEKTGWRKGDAAELLEISQRALLYKMKEYNIKK